MTISARDIYDQVIGLRDDVRSLVQSNVEVDSALADHEDRLRAIERWKYSIPAAVVTSLVTAVVTFIRGTGGA
ncbi:hypothetical protein [Allostreptomyces psammosilenae]|uniref:Uncharacterized protein n=1 Tax=Allostreptomyces psammosilenae TaxID=1892865 RepID=A0A852ZWL6_9ACTN|nr:hypothetical protein [Allostreptomyces psammosilenae]NYI06077.1 hypothetical protein [Allostreptomyces psammosilenae]